MATTFPKIDFTQLDLSKLDTDQVVTALRDAAYITIGFGVLTVQQAQVRRRELASFLSERLETSKSQVEALPTQAAGYVDQAHAAAKSARQQMCGFLRQAV